MYFKCNSHYILRYPQCEGLQLRSSTIRSSNSTAAGTSPVCIAGNDNHLQWLCTCIQTKMVPMDHRLICCREQTVMLRSSLLWAAWSLLDFLLLELNNCRGELFTKEFTKIQLFLLLCPYKSISNESMQLPYRGSIRCWLKMTSGVGVG